MRKILQANEKPARNASRSEAGGVLRQIAHEVPVHDIKTAKIKKVLKEMSEALKSQDDGVAIAAPQIRYLLRIFIVSGKIFAKDFAGNREERLLNQNNIVSTKGELASGEETKEKIKNFVFINPKISKFSREKEWMPEGCLSVRPLYGKTFRSKKVMLTAYDEKGKKFVRGASGLLAQILQHETDHLNGILFIDNAKEIKEELPKQHA